MGYNSLSQLDPDPIDTTLPPHEMQNKPQAKRLWTWLIICDDSKSNFALKDACVSMILGTIITINENPFPDYGQPRTPDDEAKLYIMRRHLLNVFQQLSKSKDAMREKNPMMALPIRSGLKGIKEPDVTATDAPSLLFHYLFDDWYTTYSLVAKQEHQYGKKLSDLASRYRQSFSDYLHTIANGHVLKTRRLSR